MLIEQNIEFELREQGPLGGTCSGGFRGGGWGGMHPPPPA